MSRITKKLSDNSGATFMMALLALLVATMVSVLVLGAAFSASKGVVSDRAEEQAHQTLVSAAKLIEQEMESTSRTTTTTVTTNTGTGAQTTDTESKYSGTFRSEMEGAMTYVDKYGSDYTSDNSSDFTLAVDGLDMDRVTGSYVMSSAAGEKYNIVFTIAIEDVSEMVYLTMNRTTKSSATTQTKGNVQTKTTVETVSWGQAVIKGLQ